MSVWAVYVPSRLFMRESIRQTAIQFSGAKLQIAKIADRIAMHEIALSRIGSCDKIIMLKRNNGSKAISASEISQYVYCPVSWYLKRSGVQPQSCGLKRGIGEHKKAGEQADPSGETGEGGRHISMAGRFLLSLRQCCSGGYYGHIFNFIYSHVLALLILAVAFRFLSRRDRNRQIPCALHMEFLRER